MTSLAQNKLENFQQVTETVTKPSRSDENLNTLFYNGKAVEKEIQTEQTGEFPSWISGRVSRVVQGSWLTVSGSSSLDRLIFESRSSFAFMILAQDP